MGIACVFGHKWNGCTCTRCGKTRSDGHTFQQEKGKCAEKCTICGLTRPTSHQWNGCKCDRCGEVRDTGHNWQMDNETFQEKCSICGKTRKWQPTNPRFASNMPLRSLLRIFVFTDGDGHSVLNSPVAIGTLSDTLGEPAQKYIGRGFMDIIAHSNVGKTIIQTSQFPQEGWAAMSAIDTKNTRRAQNGELRTCVRTFSDPTTNESGALVLLYELS